MMSKHASARRQQRAIPPILIDMLFDFGKCESAQRGTDLLYFDRAGKAQARAELQRNKSTQFDHCLNAYVVVSHDGNIITVGHLAKRINRN